MLKITVELWPFGEEKYKKTLTTFDIANNGTGDVEQGNYDVRLPPLDRWHKNIVIEHFRDIPVLQLVYKALKGLNDKGEI